jgi:DNA-binding NtrC family response regulator
MILETTLYSLKMDSCPEHSTVTPRLHVLVVDEDEAVRSACVEIAKGLGYAAESRSDLSLARSALAIHAADILLLNLSRNSDHGEELLSEIRALYPLISVVVTAPDDSPTLARVAVHSGATDFLTKPFSMDELTAALEHAAACHLINTEARRLRERLRVNQGVGGMIGRSSAMEKLYRLLSKVAQSSHPVLILGESGTGKELVARTIHECGPKADKPFLPVDCGSLVPTLIESELFGYVKGAFTGANQSRDGLLVSAGNGTVFLDEIGELTLDLQAKLLRALQEKEVRPIGAAHRVPIKARILTATNRDLASMVESGTFRKDLFYRLNVVNLRLPPLRDRRDDIPLLIAHFLDRVNKNHPGKFSIDDRALRAMMSYPWPGNVRELENAIERGITMASGGELQLGDLPTQLQQEGLAAVRAASRTAETGKEPAPGEQVRTLAEMERKAILTTIRKLNGDKLKAAKLLGIGKTTLYRKLKEYGIDDPMQEEQIADEPSHRIGMPKEGENTIAAIRVQRVARGMNSSKGPSSRSVK